MKAITTLPLLLPFASLITSSAIDVAKLGPRESVDCPSKCTDCPYGGKFVLTKFSNTLPLDKYALYFCFYPPNVTAPDCPSSCEPPSLSGCAPVANPTPKEYKPAEPYTYCSEYCDFCPGGYTKTITEVENINNGLTNATAFLCANSTCSGLAPDLTAQITNTCQPSIPSTCPLPPASHGWCGLHITQYQKNPASGAKNSGNEWFMFDFRVYDPEGWPLGITSAVVIPTNQTKSFPVPQLSSSIYVTAGALDISPIGLSYNGVSWNTGTDLNKKIKKQKNPHFSTNGPYSTPSEFTRDKAGQREIDTGFMC